MRKTILYSLWLLLVVFSSKVLASEALVYKAVSTQELKAVYLLYKKIYPKPLSEEGFFQDIRSRENVGYEIYFVIKNGRVIGAVGLQLAVNPLGKDYMSIDMVAMDPKADLKHVATLFGNFLISYARGMSLVAIEVDPTMYGKQCEDFLKSLGFSKFHGKYYLKLRD